MPALSFSFAHVSGALAACHDIAEDRMSAFQARLKHYQKRGFPPGINTGRGVAAEYSIEHVLKLAFALEFNQVGLNPERARRIIERNLNRLSTAIRLALIREIGINPAEIFVFFDPSGLEDLSAQRANDRADETFHYAGLAQFVENIKNLAEGQITRLAVVSVTSTIFQILACLSVVTPYSLAEILEDMKIWADRDHDDDPQA